MYRWGVGAALLLAAALVQAELRPVGKEDRERAIKELSRSGLIGDVSTVQLFHSQVPGFYVIKINNNIAMIHEDGRFLATGDVIDVVRRGSVLQSARNQVVLTAIKEVPESELVTFRAKDEKVEIWVFSDIDCGYCRTLHREMGTLNEGGVTVHYISFPRSGPATPSWKKARYVWCARDKQNAMTRAKRGEEADEFPQRETCSTDIARQYELGKSVNIKGTPALVLPDGKIVEGYVPANRLIAQLIR